MTLIECDADMSARNKQGNTPLHLACGEGHNALAMALIESNADMSAINSDQRTPVDLWAKEDVLSAIYKDGSTLLHVVCKSKKRGHIGVVKALIEKGVDVNAQDDGRNTPLHYACISGLTEVAMALVEKNARMDVSNDNGNAPLHLALICRHTEVAV